MLMMHTSDTVEGNEKVRPLEPSAYSKDPPYASIAEKKLLRDDLGGERLEKGVGSH